MNTSARKRDTDHDIAEGLKALREAHWHLARAGITLYEMANTVDIDDVTSALDGMFRLGEYAGVLDALGDAIESMTKQTRRLRYHVRILFGFG